MLLRKPSPPTDARAKPARPNTSQPGPRFGIIKPFFFKPGFITLPTLSFNPFPLRAPRSLPVSIISTVDLLRLAVLDGVVNLEQSSDEVDDTHLRLAYSMTLVRFVNLSTGECPHGVTKPLPQDVLPEKETSSYEHRCV